jgi:hypothetical protein
MLAVNNSVKNTMTNIKTVINFIRHDVLLLPPRKARWLIAAHQFALKHKIKALSPIGFKALYSAQL